MEENSALKIVEKIFQFADLENKYVLEVGCGNGRVTSLLAGKPKKLVALDPDAYEIEQAQKKISGVDFQVGSGECLHFSDECFDYVIFTLSLHHQNSKGALSEGARVLKNDGEILVIEPVIEGEIEQIFALVHNENQAKLDAQKSIIESDLCIGRTDKFNATWFFDDEHDLCHSIFEYYDMPYDSGTAKQILYLVDAKLDRQPIRITDTMFIQSLKKAL